MDVKEFDTQLREILNETNDKVVQLVIEARNSHADGWDGRKPVSYADDPNWQRAADGFAEMTGWIYDRMHGRNRLHRQSMTKKIRKALGYSYP